MSPPRAAKDIKLEPVSSLNERLVAAFLLGLALFMPPLLAVFSGGMAAGVPLLFLYLFGAWIGLIAALALIIERVGRPPPSRGPDGGDGG